MTSNASKHHCSNFCPFTYELCKTCAVWVIHMIINCTFTRDQTRGTWFAPDCCKQQGKCTCIYTTAMNSVLAQQYMAQKIFYQMYDINNQSCSSCVSKMYKRLIPQSRHQHHKHTTVPQRRSHLIIFLPPMWQNQFLLDDSAPINLEKIH